MTVPTVVVLNTSNQQYFLLDRQIKNTEDMVQFINSILDGTVEVSCSLLFQRTMTGGGRESSSQVLKGKVSGPWEEGTLPSIPCIFHNVAGSSCQTLLRVEMSYKGDLGHFWLFR